MVRIPTMDDAQIERTAKALGNLPTPQEPTGQIAHVEEPTGQIGHVEEPEPAADEPDEVINFISLTAEEPTVQFGHVKEPEPQYLEPRLAASFEDENIRFLWYPYLPIGDYTVVMGDGGVGKTFYICGIAANVSTGNPLPGQIGQTTAKNVLIISAEDDGPTLKKRLVNSGADVNQHIYILDRTDSIGLSFSDGYDVFERTVSRCKPSLVIVDPWQAFLGASVDINRVNALRPVLQKIAGMAKKCNCALILLSHVNKRAQGENANNAATGSTDLINAARSAIRVIKDGDDYRVAVHTKSNHARVGQSVCFSITDSGGLEWEGFSDITREVLEEAARKHKTVREVAETAKADQIINAALVKALEDSANFYYPKAETFGYQEFQSIHGEDIFGTRQPKRALDAVKAKLYEDGYILKTGLQCRVDGEKQNGFSVWKIAEK